MSSQVERPSAKEIRERHLQVLRAFVYRARRVEGHSIARDRKMLLAFSSGTFTMEMTGGKVEIVQQLPREEQLESLAARVRPMLLQKEPTHNAKVTGALKAFAGDNEEFKLALKDLRRLWHRIRPERKDLLAWSAQVKPGPDAPVEEQTDLQLAYAWLYGDVVHGDQDRLADAKSFGRDERFRAAVLVFSNAALLTIATYNVLRTMRDQKLIEIDDSYFDELIEVIATEYRHEASVSLAPLGTVVPPLGEPWGTEWAQVDPASVSEAPPND